MVFGGGKQKCLLALKGETALVYVCSGEWKIYCSLSPRIPLVILCDSIGLHTPVLAAHSVLGTIQDVTIEH